MAESSTMWSDTDMRGYANPPDSGRSAILYHADPDPSRRLHIYTTVFFFVYPLSTAYSLFAHPFS